MATDSVQDVVLLESDVEDLELLELSCARVRISRQIFLPIGNVWCLLRDPENSSRHAEILVFRVQANNDALCIFRGKFAKPVLSSKDASRSRLRHLCSVPLADVRLIFDSCPDVICIWSAETVRHMQQGDTLIWARFRATFPIPDECLEATQKRISYTGLALKQMLKLQKIMPEEVTCEMEADASDEGGGGSLGIALKHLQKYAGSSVAAKDRSPNSESAFMKAFNSGEDLDPKSIKQYGKVVRSLVNAAQVALNGFSDAVEEELRLREEAATDQEVVGASDCAGGDDAQEKPLDGPWLWPVMDWLAQRDDATPEILQMNNVRVVPHTADSENMTWTEEWKGAYLYDGINGQAVPAQTMEEFGTFYKSSQPIPPPCRNKVSNQTVSFASCFVSQDWTSSDESLLRSSYWACHRCSADQTLSDALAKAEVNKQLVEKAAGRLCCARYQGARAEFSQVGFSQLLMRRMVYCVDGIRFFAGVPIKALQEHLSETKSQHQDSFYGACAALPEMAPISVFELGGFCTTLQANQVLEIPPGFLCAEALLTETNTIMHWTTLRPIKQDLLDFKGQIDVAHAIVEHDKATLSEDKRSTLDVCNAQIQAAGIIQRWAEQKSRAIEDDVVACPQGPGARSLATLWMVKMWVAEPDGRKTAEQFARVLAGLIAQSRVFVPWTEVSAAAGIEDDSETSRQLLGALVPSFSSDMQLDVPDALGIIRSLLPEPATAARGQASTAAPAAATQKHTSKQKPREKGREEESARAGPPKATERKKEPVPKHGIEADPAQQKPPPPGLPSKAPQPTVPTETSAVSAAVSPTAATPASSSANHHTSEVPAAAAAAASVERDMPTPLPKPSAPQAGSPPTPATPQEPSEAEIALAEMRKQLASTGGHRFQGVSDEVGNQRKRQKLGSPKEAEAPKRLPSSLVDDDHDDDAPDLQAAVAKPGEGTGGEGTGSGDHQEKSSSSEEDESSDDDDADGEIEKPDSYEDGDSPVRESGTARGNAGAGRGRGRGRGRGGGQQAKSKAKAKAKQNPKAKAVGKAPVKPKAAAVKGTPKAATRRKD